MLENEKNKEQKINIKIIKVIFWINLIILFLVIFSIILKNSIIDKAPNVIKKNNSKKLDKKINITNNNKVKVV